MDERVSVSNGEECLEAIQVAVLQLLKEEWPKYKNSSMVCLLAHLALHGREKRGAETPVLTRPSLTVR